LRTFALGLPGAYEEFPWGESVAKVAGKVFAYLGREDSDKVAASSDKRAHVGEPGSLGISVKLPTSGGTALSKPFAQPTGYGLGAKGWVSFYFAPGDSVPLNALIKWIEESYRAVAPKRLVKELDHDGR
jgi:predicted DNA-binding protein (MmcQ/YjbR family)